MTTDEKLEKLIELATIHDSQIHSHERQLEELTRQHMTTLESIQALERIAQAHADEVQQLTREWQAYLRRLPPQ
ncbi:MAG TPA: hypothetical protein VE959_27930 [Bryobacteraceae bacterium]|nr:hypothetical protein [Bryobacteraceae bacterium]